MLDCDVLAGERGPSYTDVSQIKNWKMIHVRFIENFESAKPTIDLRSHKSEPNRESPKKSNIIPAMSTSAVTSTAVPRSVSISQMLKLGKLIVPETDIVNSESVRVLYQRYALGGTRGSHYIG